MAVGDVYRARACCYTPTQIGLNITYWEVTSETGTGASDPFLLSAQLDSILASNYKNLIPSVVSGYRGVGCAMVKPTPGPEFATVGSAGTGTWAGASAITPTQSTGLISWKTNEIGPKGRGRIYVPFVPDDATNADGSPSASYLAVLNTLRIAYIGAVVLGSTPNTSSLTLVLWHKASATTSTIITTLTRNRIATQRRRGQYGRMNVLPF